MFNDFIGVISDSFTIDSKAIEELRVILSDINEVYVEYDEAEEIGRSLITILETLANGRKIIADRNYGNG